MIIRSIAHLALAAGLAGLTACDTPQPIAPTGLLAVPPPPAVGPPPTYTVSGVISEITTTGLVPIEGVLVDAGSYEESTRKYIDSLGTTDADGRYSIPGVWGGPGVDNGLWLTKAGYRIEPQLNPSCDGCYRTFAVSGDTRLDIQLERLTTATSVASTSSRRH